MRALIAWRGGLFLTEGEIEVLSMFSLVFNAGGSVCGCMCVYTHTHAREKRLDTYIFGQLQHFMILWAIIEYCDLKVGNVSTSCFYAPRTRIDVPGDPSGPLYCVVFAVFGSRVFPHPFFIFATACSCRFHVYHTTYPFPPGPHLKYLSTCEYSFVPREVLS